MTGTQRDETARVLVLDGDPDDRELAAFVLRRGAPGLSVVPVADAAAFAVAAARGGVAVVVTAADLGWSDAASAIAAVRGASPSARAVLFTAPGDDEALAAALERGLDRYVVKGSAGFVRLVDVVADLTGQARARGRAAGPPAAVELAAELQTPLALVARYARLLGDAFVDRQDERGAQWVARLVASAERMEALVDDALVDDALVERRG